MVGSSVRQASPLQPIDRKCPKDKNPHIVGTAKTPENVIIHMTTIEQQPEKSVWLMRLGYQPADQILKSS